jgi:glycosyltransferase involved in cell wall biosynthesis
MRIAVLIYGLDGIGGIAKHTLYLCRELVGLGHQVTIYTVEFNQRECYPEITSDLDVRPFRQIDAPTPHSALPDYPGLRLLSYAGTLWKYYHEQAVMAAALADQYDVINPHGNTISWTAAAHRRNYGTPVVWLCNDFMPIGSHRYETVSGKLGHVTNTAKELLFSPVCHHDEAAVRSIDTIAVLSEKVKAQMHAHYGVHPQVVRPGVDSAKFLRGDGQVIRQRYGISQETFLLLTVAMPMPRRRIEDVIHAVHLLRESGRDAAYIVVGRTSHHSDYMDFLHREISRLNLESHVTFTGEVTEEDLTNAYHAGDAFVWASDENQSWGMAGMEAMAAGKPTLVSRANGLAEVLPDDVALLIEPRSPEAVATAVESLLAEPEQARRMAQRGQQFVQEHYSWRRHAEEMVALFEAAIAQKKPARSLHAAS